jgi:hypothetical protein
MATKFEPYFKRFFSKFKQPEPALFEASTSASFDLGRSKGGNREFLRDQKRGYSSEYTYESAASVSDLPGDTENDGHELRVKMIYDIIDQSIGSDLLHMYEARPGVVHELRGKETWTSIKNLLNEIKARRHDLVDVPGPLDDLVKALDAIDPSLTEFAVKQDLLHTRVGVSAVCEPYKVRLVTKGESFKYYISRFYQKGLWKHLQSFPQFCLTGRPVQHHDFFDVLDREKKLGITNFDLWVSGDFSAATDNLKIFYTKMAFEASLEKTRYSEFLNECLRAVIYEQTLTYPEMRTSKEVVDGVINPLPDAVQTTGQLMGSTLSFPILCAVNFVCYWMALEIHLKRKVSPLELPVLINGDDILFRASKEFYALWQSIIQEVGFELSMGKNYVHKTFFTINSQGFSWNAQTQTVKDVPYFNIGLLTGQSKLGGIRVKSLSPIWDFYNPVLEGASDKARAHRRFMHYHKHAISELTCQGNFNLFISPVLGGLGFNLNPAVQPLVHFTYFQRRFGYFLKKLAMHPFGGEYEKFQPFVGLVNPIKSKILSTQYYHWSQIEVRPQISALRDNEVKVMDTVEVLGDSRLAINYTRSLPGEVPLVTVRPPNKKVMFAFRNAMTKEGRPSTLLSFPYIWVEIIGKAPEVRESNVLPQLMPIPKNPFFDSPQFLNKLFAFNNESFNYKSHLEELTIRKD